MMPASSTQTARWKTGFFLVMAALFLLVCWVDERFVVDSTDREWTHIAPYKYVLLTHGLAGLVALLTGATQFWDRLRLTRPQLHRTIGKIYVAACAVGGPAALYMQLRNASPIFLPAGLAHSLTWMFATAMALWCIKARNMLAHRAWMMRSYAMVLIFITVRVPDAFPQLAFDSAQNAVIELLQIVVMLLGVEVILTVRELNRKRRPARG